MSKEYNNRWDKPLVNPGFTFGEYERDRKIISTWSVAIGESVCDHDYGPPWRGFLVCSKCEDWKPIK